MTEKCTRTNTKFRVVEAAEDKGVKSAQWAKPPPFIQEHVWLSCDNGSQPDSLEESYNLLPRALLKLFGQRERSILLLINCCLVCARRKKHLNNLDISHPSYKKKTQN